MVSVKTKSEAVAEITRLIAAVSDKFDGYRDEADAERQLRLKLLTTNLPPHVNLEEKAEIDARERAAKSRNVRQLLDILRAHHDWLRGDGGERADFTGRNMSGLKLPRLDLSMANLSGCDFSGTDLSESKLQGANLAGSNLAGANLKDADLSMFKGPMALAIGFDDEVAPARAIFQFAKEHKALEIVGGITEDGATLTAAEVKALASLPTKDQLLGQLVGTIAAPLSSFVGVLNGNVRSIVTVLAAIGEAKGE